MKNLRITLTSAIFAAIFCIGTVGYSQVGAPGYATVVRVQGNASYSLGDDNWHPLVAGKTLTAGAVIRTGDNGVVDVVLGKQIDFPQSKPAPTRISQAADAPVRGLIGCAPSSQQNAVRLVPGTVLAIDKLTVGDTGADTVSDTELDLRQGKIFASVKKLSATSQYLVKVPNGIAGIRGTECSIDSDDNVAVFETSAAGPAGGVVLSLTINGVTNTYDIQAGQMLELANSNQPAPITPDLESILSGVFNTLKTTYNVIINFDYSNNNCYISSLTGTGTFKAVVNTPPPGP